MMLLFRTGSHWSSTDDAPRWITPSWPAQIRSTAAMSARSALTNSSPASGSTSTTSDSRMREYTPRNSGRIMRPMPPAAPVISRLFIPVPPLHLFLELRAAPSRAKAKRAQGRAGAGPAESKSPAGGRGSRSRLRTTLEQLCHQLVVRLLAFGRLLEQLPGFSGQLDDVQAGVRTIGEIDQTALVDLDVVGMDGDAALLDPVDLGAKLFGVVGGGGDVEGHLLGMKGIPNVDHTSAGGEVRHGDKLPVEHV